MDINLEAWVGAFVAGGVVGVVVESTFGTVTAWRQRRHDSSLQRSEHEHLRSDHELERDHQRAVQDQALQHDREMKALDRQHERLSRRDQSHDEHRERFAAPVADFIEWVAYELGTEYGPDRGDWYPELSGAPSIASPDEAASAIRVVATMHPTAEVRHAADELYRSLTGHYGSIMPDRDGNFTTRIDPSFERMHAWQEAAELLLELVHQPPPDADADQSI